MKNQDVDERVEVGDGAAVAQLGAFDAEFDLLTVDAFRGRALVEDGFVRLAVSVDLIAHPRADAGGYLEMSTPKTLITHARTEHAKFLGYAISIYQADTRLTSALCYRLRR